MTTQTKKWKALKMAAKIKAALDGRTQRWLGEKIEMDDVSLSNKLNGVYQFSEDELKKIEQILNIKLP